MRRRLTIARRRACSSTSAVAGLFVIAVGGVGRAWRGRRRRCSARGWRSSSSRASSSTSTTSCRELKAHRENPTVRAVVMRINSPGGVVGPTQELHDAVLRLRQAGKPVVASLGAVAASGGYYVAVAADQIYANPGTLTGSIGVIMQLANFEQLMKKVGVDYVVVKAGQFKDIGNLGAPDDARGAARAAGAARRRARPVHRRRGRRAASSTREEVVRFADGRVFSGAQAKDLKMVDALGGLEDAVTGGRQAGRSAVAARGRSSRKRQVLHHGPAAQPVRRRSRRRRCCDPRCPRSRPPCT